MIITIVATTTVAVVIITIVIVVVVADVIRICNGIIVLSEKGIAAITKSVAIIVLVHAKRLNTRSSIFLFLHGTHSENLCT